VTTIEGSVVLNNNDDAFRHIVYDVDANTAVTPSYLPAYRADNTYTFIIDMGSLVPAPSGPAILLAAPSICAPNARAAAMGGFIPSA